MSTFVLVHGAWHGEWCWDKVVPLLEEAGHEVVTFDLPGHGRDQTPVAEVTLADYTGRVVDALDERDEPVVLVGHSLSGTVISQAAERRPERIERLVYLSAFLLPSGQSAIEASQQDEESMILQSIEMDEENGRVLLTEDGMKNALYHDCPEEDFERAKRLITPQPLAPFGTPVEVSDENFGSVRRTYVKTTIDRAVSPSMQDRMLRELPCEEVLSLETGHMSFFANPEGLARNLDTLSKP